MALRRHAAHPPRPHGRRPRRGFSLIEALISAGVLGVALYGLVEMHSTSVRGTARAEDVGRAAEIARQIADRIVGEPAASFPAGCGAPNTPLPPGQQGCRATPGPGEATSAPRPFPCTRYVEGDAVTDVANGETALPALDPVTTAPDRIRAAFRVDTMISSHPNGSPDASLVHVWTCWRDGSGLVNEVYTSRTRIEGVW